MNGRGGAGCEGGLSVHRACVERVGCSRRVWSPHCPTPTGFQPHSATCHAPPGPDWRGRGRRRQVWAHQITLRRADVGQPVSTTF
jgi:hypothetical protein